MESSAGSSTDLASPGNPANQGSPDNATMPGSSASAISKRTVMNGRLIVAGRRLLRLLRPLRRRRRAPAPLTAKKAGIILAVLAVLAAAFASTTAVLANRAISAMGASTPTSTAPLITPAPALAAGLPRHYRLVTDQPSLLAIAQFRARFAVLRGGSAAVYPQGLYGEPGRVYLASDSAGWVMYLGYNAPASLGDPAATARRLMTALASRGRAPARSWQVPAGAAGGAARCMIAVVGPTRMSVCGWATGYTMAAVMSPASVTSTNELAALMPFMRLDLQPG